MNKLINLFYSYSLPIRIALIGFFYALFLFSAGLYTYSHQKGWFTLFETDSLMEKMFGTSPVSGIPDLQLDERLSLLKDEDDLAKSLLATMNTIDHSIPGWVQSQKENLYLKDPEVVFARLESLNQFSDADFMKLLLHKLQNHGIFPNFRKMRHRADALLNHCYQARLKGEDAPLLPVVRFLFQFNLLTEFTDGVLITKMITSAIDRKIVQALYSLSKKNLLKEGESAELAKLLKNRAFLRIPLKQVILSEKKFAMRAMLSMNHSNPIIYYALEKIYGDPILKYQELMTLDHLLKPEMEHSLMLQKEHPFLQIAMPNMSRAFRKLNERSKTQTMLQSYLISKDLKNLDSNEFGLDEEANPYWFGENLADQKGKGDDVLLKEIQFPIR